MNIFDTYTHTLLKELNDNSVEFLVVGGYAVNFHGYRRTTGDIDLWIKPDNAENKNRIIKCLRNMKIGETNLKNLMRLDFTKTQVFFDGKEPYKIDFMTQISGVKFEDAWKQKIISNIDGLKIPFINLTHLLISKITSDRAKDKIDVEELQKISKHKKFDGNK